MKWWTYKHKETGAFLHLQAEDEVSANIELSLLVNNRKDWEMQDADFQVEEKPSV